MAQTNSNMYTSNRALNGVDHLTTHRQREYSVVDKKLQYRQFGGFHFGAAFFGWLVSSGMGVILISLLAAAGSAVAVTSIKNPQAINSSTATTVGLTGGLLLLMALAISYYAGGYVAGRMSRFDGARQGFGVWTIGILVTTLLGVIGAFVGSQYNVLQQLNLPHVPINQGSYTKAGLITSLAIFVVSLVAAISGGKAGEKFHRKIDNKGTIGQAVR